MMIPEDQVSKQLRKFCIHYSGWHPESEAVRNAFIAVRNARDWNNVIAVHYADNHPGQYPAKPGGSTSTVDAGLSCNV